MNTAKIHSPEWFVYIINQTYNNLKKNITELWYGKLLEESTTESITSRIASVTTVSLEGWNQNNTTTNQDITLMLNEYFSLLWMIKNQSLIADIPAPYQVVIIWDIITSIIHDLKCIEIEQKKYIAQNIVSMTSWLEEQKERTNKNKAKIKPEKIWDSKSAINPTMQDTPPVAA